MPRTWTWVLGLEGLNLHYSASAHEKYFQEEDRLKLPDLDLPHVLNLNDSLLHCLEHHSEESPPRDPDHHPLPPELPQLLQGFVDGPTQHVLPSLGSNHVQ